MVGCMSGHMFKYDILAVHSSFSTNVDHVPPAPADLSRNFEYDPVKVVGPLSKMPARHITFSEWTMLYRCSRWPILYTLSTTGVILLFVIISKFVVSYGDM